MALTLLVVVGPIRRAHANDIDLFPETPLRPGMGAPSIVSIRNVAVCGRRVADAIHVSWISAPPIIRTATHYATSPE